MIKELFQLQHNRTIIANSSFDLAPHHSFSNKYLKNNKTHAQYGFALMCSPKTILSENYGNMFNSLEQIDLKLGFLGLQIRPIDDKSDDVDHIIKSYNH